MAGRWLADLIWPPVSPLSNEEVNTVGELSPADWNTLQLLGDPVCDLCGVPFPYPVGQGAHCAPCIAKPPRFSRARSAFVYDEHSRSLVLQLKYGGRTDTLKVFGRWMSQAGRDLLRDADGLMPVPLHPSRMRQRRFNQSQLLARALSEHTGLPVFPHALRRTRRTPTQEGKSAKARHRNVSGAFRLEPKYRDQIAGQRLVLIDDVYTTGATLNACTRTLERGGAADVMAITLARVVKPVDPLK